VGWHAGQFVLPYVSLKTNAQINKNKSNEHLKKLSIHPSSSGIRSLKLQNAGLTLKINKHISQIVASNVVVVVVKLQIKIFYDE